MTRYLIAGMVALVAAALLIGVIRNPSLANGSEAVPNDELLAYRLEQGHDVTLALLQQTSELRLTTWSIVERAAPEERFPYSLKLDWLTPERQSLGTNVISFESRVSQISPGLSPASFAARLAYSNQLVTDSRTVRLVVPKPEGQQPSHVRLTVADSSAGRVLVRATFPERRQPLELLAVDRRLSASERFELIRDRTSVDYDDFAYALRSVGIATWQRRLDAQGLENKDYWIERLLIGQGRTSIRNPGFSRYGFPLDRSHSLALNVFGPLDLEVTAPSRASLQIADGMAATPQPLGVGEGGLARFSVSPSAQVRTIVLSTNSESPSLVHVSIRATQLGNFLGPSQPLALSQQLAVGPMIRRSTYYTLDPTQPLVLRLETGQKFLGLTVRGTHLNPSGRIDAELAGIHASTTLNLPPSTFEQWTNAVPATDGEQLFVQVPSGVHEVSLRGSENLRVSPFTLDPQIPEDRLAPEYAVPLPPDSRWKFARFDIDRQVMLRPLNEAELERSDRKTELLAQSRVVGTVPENAVAESALVPATLAVQRQVIEPVRWGPGIPLPEDVVVALDRARNAYVPRTGPRASRIRLAYRLAPDVIGETLELRLDDSVVHREQAITALGQFELTTTAGQHRFELSGLRGSSQALLEATPLESAGAMRRRVVYRIAPGAVLRFVLNKRVDAIRVIVTTYAKNQRLLSLRYAVVGAIRQDFAQAATALGGEISGVASAEPGTFFWGDDPSAYLHRHRAPIALGNDIASGQIALVLRNLAPAAVFVSLVLVGQDEGNRPKIQRFWTTEGL